MQRLAGNAAVASLLARQTADGADERTLANELSHVVQQRAGPVERTVAGAGLQISDAGDTPRSTQASVASDAAAPSPAVAQRATVYDASGAPTEYPDSDIRWDPKAYAWKNPRGVLLHRNADGTFSTKDSPQATDAPQEPTSGSQENASPSGNQSGKVEGPEKVSPTEAVGEFVWDKAKEKGEEATLKAAAYATSYYDLPVGLSEGLYVAGEALWVIPIFVAAGKILGIGSFPDEAIGPCPSHSCPTDSAAKGMSGDDEFPCVLKWGHKDVHRCANKHVWADKWNTAWAMGSATPEAAGL
jgi:hypothetical protein